MANLVAVLQEFPYTFPLTFGEADKAIVIEDGLEAVQLYTQDPYLWFAYEHQSVFFQADPGGFFEAVWTPAIGQQEPLSLMPIYDERYLWGDIANMPDFWLSLFNPAHFGPDGDGDFPGPGSVDILEGPARVEVR